MAAATGARDLRLTQEGDRFPESLGERLFVAFLVALPTAVIIAATVGMTFGRAAGLASFGALLLAVVVGLTPFLGGAPARAAGTAPPLGHGAGRGTLAACPVCAEVFVLRRGNQRYCSPSCRQHAARERRRSS